MYGSESWTIKKVEWWKNWCFWTVVLGKTLESPLESKETKPMNTKENQSWLLFERTDVEAEAPILWSHDAKNELIGKDPDAGKDSKQEEKGMTEEWDGWMALPTQWTSVWASSWCCWWIGKPGLPSMWSQRVRHNWMIELNQWWMEQ